MKLLTATGVALLLSGMLAVVWTYNLNPNDFDSNLYAPIILLMVFGTVILGLASFSLARLQIPRVRVRVIAVVFLIIALSVPATFFYAQQTSLIGCLCTGTGTRVPIIVTGSITVPSSYGNGTLTLQIRNDQNSPITSVNLTNVGPSPANSSIPSISNLSAFEAMYLGEVISATNPLPVNQTATGSLAVTNVQAGTTYEMVVAATFQPNGSSYQTLSITAQD
jgi:hypothetical protein